MDEAEDKEGLAVEDVNFSNQVIGEVQQFILVIKWLVREFYNFDVLERKYLTKSGDFEAIEEDLLFSIHKMTVQGEVLEYLVVLSRLLNSKNDKKLRSRFKELASKNQGLFPLE